MVLFIAAFSGTIHSVEMHLHFSYCLSRLKKSLPLEFELLQLLPSFARDPQFVVQFTYPKTITATNDVCPVHSKTSFEATYLPTYRCLRCVLDLASFESRVSLDVDPARYDI